MAASRASVAKAAAAKTGTTRASAAAKPVVIPTADFVISEEELAELVRPFVAQIGAATITLRSVNTFTLEDLQEISTLSDESPLEALIRIAADDESADALRTMGLVILQRTMEAWFASVQASRGESDSSTS